MRPRYGTCQTHEHGEQDLAGEQANDHSSGPADDKHDGVGEEPPSDPPPADAADDLIVRVATGLSGFAQLFVAMVILVGLLQAFNRQWPTR